MVFAPLISVSVILTIYQINGRMQEMTDTLEKEGRLVADHISNDSEHYMFTGDDGKLQSLIDEVVERADVEAAVILDRDGGIIVSAGLAADGEGALNSLVITRPIIYKDTFVDEINKEIESLDVNVGQVRLNMSAQVIQGQQREILFDSLVILFAGLMISGIIVFLLSRSLFLPLKKLHAAVDSISAGKFNTKLSIQQGGEFSDIEHGINKMANELQVSKDQQKKKIDEATQALMELVLQLEQKNVLLDEAREEAEEIGNSKVEFLANMSHEIRTPLNAVIGASDLLMKIIRDDDATKYMSTLSVASRQLNSVVDDILDFSRMEANKLELEHVAFNIMEVLESVISLYSPLANEKNLELLLQVESGMPASIFGDPMRISQVVSNLVSNAIKFTEQGKVIVSANSVVINNINLRLQINVKDTGAGLTEQAKEKLYDAFAQADNAVARKYGGSGLGLAIVRKLIEQMQGFINVKSTVDEGTEFNIHLDLKLDKRKQDDFEKKLTGLTVLLYERDRVTEEAVKNKLHYWGVDVILCKNDDDFIGNLMRHKVDGAGCSCIILGMGRDTLAMSSIEDSISKIRHLSVSPVILLLNAGDYTLPTNVIDEQVCYIGRPVSRQVLYEKLRRISNKDTSIADQSAGVCVNEVMTDVATIFENLNILIAEDNDFNRDLLTDMLTAYGAQVDSVVDGQFAVEAALKGTYDIIFLDLHMPRKDGITAANEIKNAALENPPLLVAATADVFIKDQGDDVDVFDSFVFKPIREEVLLEKVTTLLNFQGDYNSDRPVDEDADNELSEKLDREVRKLVLHIVEGSNNDDYAEIVNYAHQLRGVCGFYELTEMTVVATGLERSAKEKRREDVILLIKVLLKQLNISPDYKTIR